MSAWNIKKVEKELSKSFENNSEIELLKILKKNSFLFYELYSRRYGIQPNFTEVSFGGKYRCDFAWLNDSSDGPEWVLVEVEKPEMRLFTQKNEPTKELNHAIEQVKSWSRYFHENPLEKKRIFGAVSRFRYILVAGSSEEWQTESASKWRAYHNANSPIEIRSTNVFEKALRIAKEQPAELWSFEENPISLSSSELEKYWKELEYLDKWRQILN